MKSWLRSRLARMLAGLLCAALAATWAVGEVLDRHDEVRRDQNEVARMTQNMKTVCVGRFLIDMPEDAQVELSRPRIDSFDISAFEETLEDFQKRLAERESQLRSMPDRLGGNKNLESARDVKTDSGLTGKIFIHSRTVIEGTQGNGLGVERYRHEGISVEAIVHGSGISIDLSSEKRGLAWVGDLPKLVNKLVANPDNRVPAEPGFCIDRAYFRDPLTADQREQIMMFARLPSHPDIDFMLTLSAGLKPDEHGLLARSEALDSGLSMADRMRISRLRAAPREISGLPGEELVELFVEKNDARVHSFWWEVNGTEHNVLVPHFVFKMSTGNGNHQPVSSSLSDGAAIGLWDQISSSIRLRSAKPPANTRIDPPTTPIGTVVSAGDHCPESGWWLCGVGGKGINVLGGQQQYIKQGEVMPQALLLPARSLWERLRGLQPSLESRVPTFWKLVDKRSYQRMPPPMPLASPVVPPATALAGSTYEQNHVSVGSFAVTGAPCPASGWWRCEQSHALDGTRWFAQGSLLPPATFAVPPGVFGRSTTAPKSIQRRGEWRLVRLAQSYGSDNPSNNGLGPDSMPAPPRNV